MNRKVSVIGGGGNVGASVGTYIAERGLADVVLIDILEGVPQGKALDLTQAAPLRTSNARLTGANDLAAVKGSDVVVITAGFPRKPGMSRSDLLLGNAEIVRNAAEAVKKNAPKATVIVVTNPLDVMAYLAYKVTGFPKNRVMGMAGVLDSARFRAFVAAELDVAAIDVQAMVLGGHGDSMVPLPRYTTVSGIPITELLPADVIERLATRTRNGGAEIVSLLKSGSAFYAPAASTYEMVKAVLDDEKRMLPCSVLLDGEYGLNDLFIGVPCVIGEQGVERVLELPLAESEKAALTTSANAVAKDISELHLPTA
ncbi:MAG TPA: malate dehydrogenase [Candidatus Eisenbacteria bacterium]|jgi:malate dehydrogenase|nr:malate dehydrogenase [Candidatus Eisenbacteria bacterium]